MLTVCWSVKGGSGTTVVTAALAVLRSRVHASTLLVDLGVDLSAALGIPAGAGPGIGDWIAADAAVEPDAVARLATVAGPGLELVERGERSSDDGSPRWKELGRWLDELDRPTVLDAGGVPPEPLLAAASASLLVLRPCYLALRRAVSCPLPKHGVVLVEEPGRALRRRDVEASLGVPVIAEVPYDPAIARAVDAGLLAARLPSGLARGLRDLA